MLHRYDAADSRRRAGQSSRGMTLAATLRNRVDTKHYQRHLPRCDDDDDDSSVVTIHRSSRNGAYSTHLERSSSDEYSSRQIDDGYSRHLSRHDDDDDEDDSPVTDFQLRPGRFGGISKRYRREFGRDPSSFLTGDDNGHERLTTNNAADNVETSNIRSRGVHNDEGYSRHLGHHDDDVGYTRQLSRHDNDEDGASSVTGLQLRPGRFGGISKMYCNEFGRDLSTLLCGKTSPLRSSIADDAGDTETNRRGREVGGAAAATSQQSDDGGSVRSKWHRHQDSRLRAPHGRMEMQLIEWPRDAESEQRQREYFVDNDNSGDGANNDVTDRYTVILPSSTSQGDISDVGEVNSVL